MVLPLESPNRSRENRYQCAFGFLGKGHALSLRSMRMKSPSLIWPVATRLARGKDQRSSQSPASSAVRHTWDQSLPEQEALDRRGAGRYEPAVAGGLKDALLHHPCSISRICSRCSDLRVLNTTTLSIRFMNSGENLRRAASCAVRVILSSRAASMSCTSGLAEAKAAGHEFVHFMQRPGLRSSRSGTGKDPRGGCRPT